MVRLIMDPYVQPQCGHRAPALEGENYIRALLEVKLSKYSLGRDTGEAGHRAWGANIPRPNFTNPRPDAVFEEAPLA